MRWMVTAWLTAGFLFLVLPALTVLFIIIRHYVERRKQYFRICTGCAYDLTGNISGVCPECGRRIDGGQVDG